MWSRALIAAALFAAGLVACSTDELIGTGDLLDIDDGASEGVSKSLKVDGSAEKKLELSTGASLTIPKGAVEQELTIKVERPSDDKALALVKTLKTDEAIASAPYVLTPHGTKFKNAVTLELPVEKHEGRELAVAWLEDENDKEWKVLAEAHVENDKVKVELEHFSVIVVLEPMAAGLDASVPERSADAGTSAPDASAGEDAAAPTEDAGDGDPRVDAGTGSGRDAGTGQPPDAAQPIEVDASGDDPRDAGEDGDAGAAHDAGAAYDAGSSYPDAYVEDDAYVPDYDAYVPDYDAYVPDYDAYVPDYDAYVPPPYDAGDYDGYVPDYDAHVPPDAGEEPDAIIFL